MRKTYEMTQEEMDVLLEAMKPVPMIMLQCGTPPSQQANANRAWMALGKKYGFDGMTVKPSEQGKLYITAEEVEAPKPKPKEPEDNQLYYIEKGGGRGPIGNCVLWWCKDQRGYTTELENAGLYNARFVKKFDSTDSTPWKKEVIDALVIKHVRSEALQKERNLGNG